jgi:hypothetical protein
MAKNNPMQRLAVPLVILVVLVGLILWLADPFGWQQPTQEELIEQDPARFTLCDADRGEINAIELTKPGEEAFTLVRDGEKWYVERGGQRYLAEQPRVDGFLTALPGLRSDSLATDDAGKHGEFEVDDLQGTGLKVMTGSGDVACELIVGKAAPGYQSAFVRLPGEDKVYRATENLKSLVGFDFKSFRARQLWPFEPSGVTALTVRPAGAEEAATFTREPGGLWLSEDGSNANQNALQEIADKFSKLRINDFEDAPDMEAAGLGEEANPNLAVTASGGEYMLELGSFSEDDAKYYARDHDSHVYRIAQANVKFLEEADLANLRMEVLPEEEGGEAGEAALPMEME